MASGDDVVVNFMVWNMSGEGGSGKIGIVIQKAQKGFSPEEITCRRVDPERRVDEQGIRVQA